MHHNVHYVHNENPQNPHWMNQMFEQMGGMNANIMSPLVGNNSGSAVIHGSQLMDVVVGMHESGIHPSGLMTMHGEILTPFGMPSNKECRIKDVWAHDVYPELRNISRLIKQYNYVAMDTEFPGVVAKPIGSFQTTGDYLYNLLKCNVDLLRIIQLGLTLFDANGNMPDGEYTTWQFNFKFSLSEDMYAQDSIDLLTNSHIQFRRHEEEGIDPFHFAAIMISTGLVLTDSVRWITFHSSFDFGYLIKMLTNVNLPEDEKEFSKSLQAYFPNIYDVKYLMKSCKNLRGGLQELAAQLELQRIGAQHQAGSDSMLTGMAFFKIRDLYFEGIIDDVEYCGQLYGLGNSVNGGSRYVKETPATTFQFSNYPAY